MKLSKFLITTLSVAMLSTPLVFANSQANAATLSQVTNKFNVAGMTFKLTKPVKISYIKMMNQPWKDHTVATKIMPKGSVLHGFNKGTEGVFYCVWGSGVKISKNVWPSVNLTNSNCKVIGHYSYKYSYEYLFKHVLHEKY